jgi:hypothetical protein
VPLVVSDLLVGEAQWYEARRGVDLVAQGVLRLLRRCAVVCQAVGLDDDLRPRPIEIDLEAVHPLPS